jgi:hypothetical protein
VGQKKEKQTENQKSGTLSKKIRKLQSAREGNN